MKHCVGFINKLNFKMLEDKEYTMWGIGGATGGIPSFNWEEEKTIPKVPVNSATFDELQQIQGVGPILAQGLMNLRNYGPISSDRALTLPGMTLKAIQGMEFGVEPSQVNRNEQDQGLRFNNQLSAFVNGLTTNGRYNANAKSNLPNNMQNLVQNPIGPPAHQETNQGDPEGLNQGSESYPSNNQGNNIEGVQNRENYQNNVPLVHPYGIPQPINYGNRMPVVYPGNPWHSTPNQMNINGMMPNMPMPWGFGYQNMGYPYMGAQNGFMGPPPSGFRGPTPSGFMGPPPSVRPSGNPYSGENPAYFPEREVNNSVPVQDRGTKSVRRNLFQDGKEQKKPTYLPKSVKFDGSSTWKAFYTKFSRFATNAKWNETEKKDQFCWCLDGKASEFYALIEEKKNHTFKELMEKFERRFGTQELQETSELKFKNSSQQLGETLEEWSDRVQMLALKAFKDLPDDYIYKQAVIRFCHGVSDRDAGHDAAIVKPKSMDDALDKVRWYQHNNTAFFGKGKRTINRVMEEGIMLVTNTTTTTPKQVSPKKEIQITAEQRMSKMEDTLSTVLTKLNTLLTSQTRRSASPGPSPNKGECYGCGKMGHFARNCPYKQNSPHKKVAFVEDLNE